MTVRLVHRPTRVTEPLVSAHPRHDRRTAHDERRSGRRQCPADPAAGRGRAHVGDHDRGAAQRQAVVPRGGRRGAHRRARRRARLRAHPARATAARTRRTQRELYLDYLETVRAGMRERARSTSGDQASNLNPAAESAAVADPRPGRLWERRRADVDFLGSGSGSATCRWFAVTVPPRRTRSRRTTRSCWPRPSWSPGTTRWCSAHARHDRLDGAGEVAVIGDRADGSPWPARCCSRSRRCTRRTTSLAAMLPGRARRRLAGLRPAAAHRRRPAVRRTGAGAAHRAVGRGAAAGARRQSSPTGPRCAAAANAASAGPATSPDPRLVVFGDDHGRLASQLPHARTPICAWHDLRITVGASARRPAARAVRRHGAGHRGRRRGHRRRIADRWPRDLGPGPDDRPAPPRSALIARAVGGRCSATAPPAADAASPESPRRRGG